MVDLHYFLFLDDLVCKSEINYTLSTRTSHFKKYKINLSYCQRTFPDPRNIYFPY